MGHPADDDRLSVSAVEHVVNGAQGPAAAQMDDGDDAGTIRRRRVPPRHRGVPVGDGDARLDHGGMPQLGKGGAVDVAHGVDVGPRGMLQVPVGGHPAPAVVEAAGFRQSGSRGRGDPGHEVGFEGRLPLGGGDDDPVGVDAEHAGARDDLDAGALQVKAQERAPPRPQLLARRTRPRDRHDPGVPALAGPVPAGGGQECHLPQRALASRDELRPLGGIDAQGTRGAEQCSAPPVRQLPGEVAGRVVLAHRSQPGTQALHPIPGPVHARGQKEHVVGNRPMGQQMDPLSAGIDAHGAVGHQRSAEVAACPPEVDAGGADERRPAMGGEDEVGEVDGGGHRRHYRDLEVVAAAPAELVQHRQAAELGAQHDDPGRSGCGGHRPRSSVRKWVE